MIKVKAKKKKKQTQSIFLNENQVNSNYFGIRLLNIFEAPDESLINRIIKRKIKLIVK